MKTKKAQKLKKLYKDNYFKKNNKTYSFCFMLFKSVKK